jgi:hypothetical protein
MLCFPLIVSSRMSSPYEFAALLFSDVSKFARVQPEACTESGVALRAQTADLH